ncbi:MAG TPA: hypothetical protein VN950_20985 [Terriglobales bacterium]|nr:hypothetical protein [Terriglobales bacterium]
MATGANRRQSDHRFDHLFFSGMAVLILVSVFVGFAHSYYLAGVFKAPLSNLLVHIHGAVFSCWIVLLIVQTSLVAAGRVDLHRRLGLLGFGLACLVVILGVLVATDSQVRHFAPGEAGMKLRAFFTVPLSTMVAFSTLIYFAFRNRFHPAAHKRLILIATIAILDAAFERWPIHAAWWGERTAALLCTVPLLLLIMGYDYWARDKIHPATIWGSIFVVVLQQVRDPIGHSAPWQAFAAWVQIHARSLHI